MNLSFFRQTTLQPTDIWEQECHLEHMAANVNNLYLIKIHCTHQMVKKKNKRKMIVKSPYIFSTCNTLNCSNKKNLLKRSKGESVVFFARTPSDIISKLNIKTHVIGTYIILKMLPLASWSVLEKASKLIIQPEINRFKNIITLIQNLRAIFKPLHQ